MHIVALVSGILGLLSLPMLAVAHSPAPLFLAVAFGLIAIITGVLSRSQGAGKAGLALGAIAALGTIAIFFLFMARSSVHVESPTVVAPHEVAPPPPVR